MNDHLNAAQVRKLGQELQNRFDEVWAEIGAELDESDNEHFMQIAGEVRDLEDESIADLLTDLNITLLDKHVQETRDIHGALMRINDGTFGTCSDCGGAIGYDRLAAYPTAKRCVDCQRVHEKTYAGGAHPRL